MQTEWRPESLVLAQEFTAHAASRGLVPSQLAIAWCVSNPNVSTVITGATRMSQLEENLGALAVVPLLTPEVRARLEAAVAAAGDLESSLELRSSIYDR